LGGGGGGWGGGGGGGGGWGRVTLPSRNKIWIFASQI